MNQKELEALKQGWVNVQLGGSIYECVGEQQPHGLVFSEVNNGNTAYRTEEDLLNDQNAEAAMPTSGQLIGIVKSRHNAYRSLLENSEYAVALFQLRDDISERREISGENYEQACKYLGDGSKPEAWMYNITYTLPMTKERMDEIGYINSYDYRVNLGDYMYEMMNSPDRPNIIDGCFGTSASISDVVVIKEKDKMTALYVESNGFKLLDDFLPEKQKEALKEKRQENRNSVFLNKEDR